MSSFVYDTFKPPPQQSQILRLFGTQVLSIIAMQLVHTASALRSIYAQRVVCDCIVHASPEYNLITYHYTTILHIVILPHYRSKYYNITG